MFGPGDEIECIDTHGCPQLTKGKTYTCMSVGTDAPCQMCGDCSPGVDLAEFPHHAEIGSYCARQFRKVQKRNNRLTLEAFFTVPGGFEEPKRTPAKRRERA